MALRRKLLRSLLPALLVAGLVSAGLSFGAQAAPAAADEVVDEVREKDPCPSVGPGRGFRGCLPDLDAEQLPDLAPLAPYYVDIREAGKLRFTTEIVNRGAYPLDLLAEPVTGEGEWIARQCMSWLGRVCLDREPVGEMVWHAAHGHWHFEEFARYELRLLDGDGEPVMDAEGLVVTSEKVSFCLQDSQQVEGSEPRFYVGCVGVLQGISPGWSDIYAAGLAGQSLPIGDVDDGRYALVFTANPGDRLLETTDADNVAWSIVELFEENGERQARIVD